MTLYVLDTNTATYVAAGRSRAAQDRYTRHLQRDRIAVSAITEGEIRFGMARTPAGARSLGFMQRFLRTVESLPWDSSITPAYGMLRAQLESKGQTLSALDMLIAAHTVALGAVLVTHDKALLRLHPAILQVEDWATDLHEDV